MNQIILEELKKANLLTSESKVKIENAEDFKTFLNNLSDKVDQVEQEMNNMKMIVDNAPCTISWLNKDLKYIGVNKNMSEQFKIPQKDFENKSLGEFTTNKDFLDFANSLFDYEFTNKIEKLLVSKKENEEEQRYYVVGSKFEENQKAVVIGIDVTNLTKQSS